MSTNTNYANFTFPAENQQGLDTALTGMETNIDPLPVYDPVLLKRLARMGRKTESFSREAISLGKINADLLPKGLSIAQAEAAIANRDMLRSRWQRARQLTKRLELAMVLCGADGYSAARVAFRSMKANTRDVALLEQLAELARTFAAKGGTSPEDDEETDGTGAGGSTGNGETGGTGGSGTTPAA